MKSDLHRLLTKRAAATPGPSAAAPGRSAVTNAKGGVPPVSTGPSQSAQDRYQARLGKSPETSVGQTKGFWGNIGDGGFLRDAGNYNANLTPELDENSSMRARAGAAVGDFLGGIGSGVLREGTSAGQSFAHVLDDKGDNTLWNGAGTMLSAATGGEKTMGDTWKQLRHGAGQIWNSSTMDVLGGLGHGVLGVASVTPGAWGAKAVGAGINAARGAQTAGRMAGIANKLRSIPGAGKVINGGKLVRRAAESRVGRGVIGAGQGKLTYDNGMAGVRGTPVESGAPASQPAPAEVASNGQQDVQPEQQNGQGFDWSQLLALAPLFMGMMNGGQGGSGMPPQQDSWTQFANRPASSYYYPQQSLYGS